MRFILLLFLFTIYSIGNGAPENSLNKETYLIIGDSVFVKNGATCHIDNFVNGKCEIEENWWDINYLNFWTGLLIPFAFFAYIVLAIKQKINNNKSE
ncbi:MAG: hypothetical protein P8L20_03320 [Flavobacteriales bacterium]|nr:hypothetical protein [Flavobacteriales bacterium]